MDSDSMAHKLAKMSKEAAIFHFIRQKIPKEDIRVASLYTPPLPERRQIRQAKWFRSLCPKLALR